ncbi:MAG: outer membrane protein assembly factor BamA [Betaproteobacteria bacterium RIFCSPLOWO2_02_FULL_66_14]|nr:MAG: outer membrane protein assembly factor BamA [Betaproteobacteria bacterium RIFCSPLOWO2_02_FULL_66_14]
MRLIRKLLWLSFGMIAAGAALAQGFQPFVVRDIRVEGVQRTEPGTVFSYLPVKVGETMTEEKAQQAIRALFATGFFRDVRLEVENDVLVVLVDERPAIARVDFSGVKEFDADTLRKVMREMGLADGRIFDRSALDGAEQELKRQYLSRGLYAAEVQTTVTPLERNRVGINFAVKEGEVSKIRSINIVGAQAFGEKDLLDLFVLRPPNWISWYTKNDQYSKQKLSADLETLRSHYLNRGYLDFNIDSTQVSITPDKRDIYITISVTEGERYTVGEIQLAGQMLVPKEELEKLINLKPGDVYSRERMTESVKAITDRLGNEGYAFANANPAPELDRVKRTVSFAVLIDPGRRVYVRRINVAGNSRTRDEVVRREMRQLEGAYYDASRIQASKQRIDRTQYFKEVNVESAPVAGTTDQVDVNFTVEEKPTGALLLGAGFSSVDKLIVSGSVSQANVFGSGKFISAQVNSGKVNQVYALNYLNPYYTVDGISQGFEVHKRRTDASSLSTGAYVTNSVGGGVRFGYPLAEQLYMTFGLSAEHVSLDLFNSSPLSYLNFANLFGSRYNYATGTVGITRDLRDSAILTTRGSLSALTTELTGGNLNYYRVGLVHQWYHPLTRNLTLALNADLGFARRIGSDPVPFFKNYYAGGPRSVRGYTALSLGPQDTTGASLGGTRKVVGNAELLFPLPGAGTDKSLRLAVFVDAGQVYAANQKIDPGELRFSTGVALSWNSPFGPLKLSLAQPLNDKAGIDRVQRIQFTFGTGF